MTVGYTPSGKRIVKCGRGRTKTEAQRKLREIIRDYEDGQITKSDGYTVARSYSDSYSARKGHDSRWGVMASDLVGRTGFEPVTSSVSEKSRTFLGVWHRRAESNGEP